MSVTNNTYLSLFPGPALSGISVYFILSYLFVPVTVTIPSAIIISILIFGLARYYTIDDKLQHTDQNKFSNIVHRNGINSNTNLPLSVSNIVFIIIYLITLIIIGFFSDPYQDLFIPWDQFSLTQIILLTSSILLCFFLPGYAIVEILDNKRHEFKPILKIVLAYIFSIAIIGFVGYISASLGYHTSEIKPILLGIYAILLITFIVSKSTSGVRIQNPYYYQRLKHFVCLNSCEILVFASLSALVVLTTYSLYKGVITGDQWLHHGRALSFLGGGYKSDLDDTFFPSFLHGILASFFTLSGVPSVNAYSSINFLNMIPVFAFYYFFNKWVPGRNPNWRKSALLACTFFMLSSGFGWISMISTSASTNPVNSAHSSAELFQLVSTRTLDIQRAGSFIITSSPQFGTSLMLIALPLGFVLLGLVKEKMASKLRYIAIIGTVTTVGILSHDEFYFFIIIACLLPLIFKLSDRKNSLYITFLCCLLFVVCIDFAFKVFYSTVQYYSASYVYYGIPGIPRIVLIILFVIFAWIIYASRIIQLLYTNVFLRLSQLRPFNSVPCRLKFSTGVVIVSVVAYLYVFSFLVWGQLTGGDIYLQQDPFHLPLYLYPLKLGVTGLLGIAFILSYFFRKFEREIFIFGLIAVTALFLGPYYDEYRLSKYIMVAMGAFAALFISRIMISIKGSRIKSPLAGIVTGSIIISSSLSVFMFAGYVGLAFENPDFDEFRIILRNKIFPTPQDINFLNFLHKNVDYGKDHVFIPLEYGGPNSNIESFKDQNLANKIQAFVGTPLTSPQKILKNPFTLNSSTIEGLYSLLNTDKIQYLILPKGNIIDNKIQLPVQFAHENFQRAFENNDYILLTVPSMVPPSTSLNGVALIYKPEGLLLASLTTDGKELQFDNRTFNAIDSYGNTNLYNKVNGTLTILNSNKRSTLWSDLLQQKQINYIETKFRTLGENDSIIGSSGLVWQNNDKEYHVSMNDNGIQLSQRGGNFDKEVTLSEDQNLRMEPDKWHTLKVLTVGNIISVYLDDLLKLQVHTSPSEITDISKVGIRVDHKSSEFEPIKIGHVPLSADISPKKEIYYNHYYPLNELSLSNKSYDTFVYGDKSAFSHKTIMLPWDPIYNDTNFKDYLQFVNTGGKLIVINTEDNFNGGFSKLLNVKAGNLTAFDVIALANDSRALHEIGVSGSTRTIDFKSLNGTVRSYYLNDNKRVAPFAIERKYGTLGGEIIFVNSAGYFEAVHKSSQQFFSSLGRIPIMLDIQVANYTKQKLPNNVSLDARFVGDLKVSGQSTTATSSLLLPNVSDRYSARSISFSNGTLPLNGADEKNKSNNIMIENLTLSGAYKAMVESTGFVVIPTLFSPYDYIGISFPDRVNLTLKMLDGTGKAQFVATFSNNTGKYKLPLSIANKEEVRFHDIGIQASSVNNQTFVMKEPLINATGNIKVNDLYIPNEGQRDANLKGLKTLVDHSDMYLTKYRNASRIQYVTYLKWIQADDVPEVKQFSVKLPGDISDSAKRQGVRVPWEKVIASKEGITLLLAVSFVTAVFLLRMRPHHTKEEKPRG